MKRLALIATLAFAAPAAAQEEPVTPAGVVEAAAPEEWIAIAPQDLLVMTLQPEPDGMERRVVIQLMPPPFSQPWVDNIRALARAHWWDGTSVYRVVDNWVAQWGGGDPEMGMEPEPLPEGVVSPVHCYDSWSSLGQSPEGCAYPSLDGPFESWSALSQDTASYADWRQQDAYAVWVDFYEGWPIAGGANPPHQEWSAWPVHCYASVGVARDLAPDTGTGSELYAVIGHAPRQLDRNIAVVGRVIDGIEHLSTLRRGTGDAGVYATRGEDTPINSVRLGDELADPPAYEYLDTGSESFARYVAVSANRSDPFYTVPAGGIDICNVKVPIRKAGE